MINRIHIDSLDYVASPSSRVKQHNMCSALMATFKI
jgi:hypothetical protein